MSGYIVVVVVVHLNIDTRPVGQGWAEHTLLCCVVGHAYTWTDERSGQLCTANGLSLFC